MGLFQYGNRLSLGALIGEGSFSKVYEAQLSDSFGLISHPVAVKVLNSRQDIQNWRQEFQSLVGVSGPRLVKFLGLQWVRGRPALIMERIPGISLEKLVENFVLSLKEQDFLKVEIEAGLRELADCHLFHGDLAPSNILITTSGSIKLIDFGLGNRHRAHFQFASSERRSGAAPNLREDLISLEEISAWMGEQGSRSMRFDGSPKEGLREKVLSILTDSQVGTVSFAPKPTGARRWCWKSLFLSLAVGLSLSCSSSFSSHHSRPGSLEVRTMNWLQVVVEGFGMKKPPFQILGLRPGVYKIRWKSQSCSSGERTLTLRAGQPILLKDNFFCD